MTIDRRHFIGAGAGATATAAAAALGGDQRAKTKSVYKMGSRRELFIDDFLIERTGGKLSYELHHPIAREQSIHHDSPWEGVGSGYHSVIQDGDLYRMYYRGLNFKIKGPQLPSTNQEVACYAESRDGIRWVKPNLGLFAHAGSKKTNIIWQGGGCHNFSPFIDRRPGCPASQRFKAFGGVKRDGGMLLFQSADGIHWKKVRDKPVITNGYFDSANIGFWDATINKYRAYWRYFSGRREIRAIRTAVSSDLITWKESHNLAYVDSPEEHMYTNNVVPYFRAPHILLGFPMRYIERGWSPSMRALPDLAKRKQRAAAHIRYGTAITDTQIMASRDGVKFKRWNEAFLPPGIERPDSWFYAHNGLAHDIVMTKSAVPGAPNELSFYATASQWHDKGTKIIRHTLRTDGFVSVTAPRSGGELTTRPLIFSGKKLTVNFATSAAGTLKVEIQTSTGKSIKGFSIKDCDETFGDSLDRVITWRGRSDVSQLAGQAIRLRITLSDTDLYAVKFGA